MGQRSCIGEKRAEIGVFLGRGVFRIGTCASRAWRGSPVMPSRPPIEKRFLCAMRACLCCALCYVLPCCERAPRSVYIVSPDRRACSVWRCWYRVAGSCREWIAIVADRVPIVFACVDEIGWFWFAAYYRNRWLFEFIERIFQSQ